jgi:hypothetical protein
MNPGGFGFRWDLINTPNGVEHSGPFVFIIKTDGCERFHMQIVAKMPSIHHIRSSGKPDVRYSIISVRYIEKCRQRARMVPRIDSRRLQGGTIGARTAAMGCLLPAWDSTPIILIEIIMSRKMN